MIALLKSSSDDFAGYDAVVSSAESLLSGMGQVLNAAGSSVTVKPKKMNMPQKPLQLVGLTNLLAKKLIMKNLQI